MQQREPNPDVNNYIPSDEGGVEEPNVPDGGGGVESPDNEDVIPVPPDTEPSYPVSDPPLEGDAPMGDVDDSPKRIAGN